MTHRKNNLGDVSFGQAEIDIQEMLHRQLHGLPHQKVFFASDVHVQETRKVWMMASIDGLNPRLNGPPIHLQALKMDNPLPMLAVSGQSDVPATEYFCPRFIVFPGALDVDLAESIFCSICSFPQSNGRFREILCM